MSNESNDMSRLSEETDIPPFSEIRYRRLFESAPDGIIVLDAVSRKIIDANPSIADLSGFSREEILGRELGEINLFKSADESRAAFRELLETGNLRRENTPMETKAGEILRVEFTVSVCAEEESRLIVQCRVCDITKRVRDEEEQSQNAQHAERLVHIAGKVARLGGWSIQLPERKLTWSDENCVIHDVPPGYQPTLQEGIGYFPPEYQAEVMRHVEECVKDGTPYDFEFPKYTAKGRLIWVRSIGEAVRDAEGNIIALQGAFQDITTRKQAAEVLRETQEQYRQMVEHASDVIYKTDAAGHFTFVNPSVSKVLKYAAEEFLSLNYLDIVRPDKRRAVRHAYTRQFVRKTPNTYYEFVAIAKDGSEVWLGQHAQLLFKDNEVTGFQAVCRDVTKKKQTEEELRRLSLTDELT